jgi:hypothetical protein
MFDLDKLSDDCTTDGIYEFMFCALPLPLAVASGNPVSALAHSTRSTADAVL